MRGRRLPGVCCIVYASTLGLHHPSDLSGHYDKVVVRHGLGTLDTALGLGKCFVAPLEAHREAFAVGGLKVTETRLATLMSFWLHMETRRLVPTPGVPGAARRGGWTTAGMRVWVRAADVFVVVLIRERWCSVFCPGLLTHWRKHRSRRRLRGCEHESKHNDNHGRDPHRYLLLPVFALGIVKLHFIAPVTPDQYLVPSVIL